MLKTGGPDVSRAAAALERWHPFAAPGAFAVITALLAWATRQTRGIDDVQITFVFARSFAEGRGLTWNGAEALGTSSPALAVVLGAASRLTAIDVVPLGLGLGWLSLWAAAVALHRLGREDGWPWAGALAGLLWITIGFSFHLGGEYLPATATASWAALMFRRERFLAAGGLLALATAFRMEVGAIAPLLAAAHCARVGLRRGALDVARAAAVSIALMAAWTAVVWATAGRVVPLTLAAKQAQAVSKLDVWLPAPQFSRILREPWTLLPSLDPWHFALLAVGGVCFLALGWRETSFATALVGWGGLHLIVLALLGVPVYPWYRTPVVLSLVLLIALATALPGRLQGRARRLAAAVTLAAAGLLLVRDAGSLGTRLRLAVDQRQQTYAEAARLAASYPPSVTIAAWEVGILAYESRRPVLDLLGLVTPETDLGAVRSGNLWENVERLDPDLLMIPLRHGSLVQRSVGDPAMFLNEYDLDHLRALDARPFAVYRKRSLPGRGNVAWHGLDARHPVRKVTLDGLGFIALPLAAGRRFERPLPPALEGRLWLGAGALRGTGRVRIAISGPRRAATDLEVDAPRQGVRWYSVQLGASGRGRRLSFTCAAAPHVECLVVHPLVPRREFDAPFLTAEDPLPARRGRAGHANSGR